MPKRLVVQTLLLTRKVDGRNEDVVPAIGQPFDFTQAELDQIEKLNPDAVAKIVAGKAAPAEAAGTVTLTEEELQKKMDDLRAQVEKETRDQVESELKKGGKKDIKPADKNPEGGKPSDDEI